MLLSLVATSRFRPQLTRCRRAELLLPLRWFGVLRLKAACAVAVWAPWQRQEAWTKFKEAI